MSKVVMNVHTNHYQGMQADICRPADSCKQMFPTLSLSTNEFHANDGR